MSDLPSRERVAEAITFAHITDSDGDLLVDIAQAFTDGRLVDREAMTPMFRQGGLSGAWYPETDGDPPDGWLLVDAAIDTDG